MDLLDRLRTDRPAAPAAMSVTGVRMLLAAVVVAVMLAAPAAAAPPDVLWHPCIQDPTADCATLAVPVDWAHPEGTKRRIALAERKAARPDDKVGTLLVNPGGPGLSGVAMVIQHATEFSSNLRGRFDLVGFDPRGINASPAVSCPDHTPDDAIPTNQQEYTDLLARNRKDDAQCVDHLSAVDVARDVEAIRIALGDRPLNWYGTSYGTEIGEQYAELFPDHIRTMVLDATIDHTRSALTHLLSATVSAEGTFDRFALWCTHSAECALHGRNVAAIFDQVRAKLRGSQLDYFDEATYEVLYAPVWGWPALGTALQTLDSGDTANQQRTAPQAGANRMAVRAAICQDWNYTVHDFTELSTVFTLARILAPHLKIADVDKYRFVNCQGRLVTDPPHPLNVVGAPPILVVNSKHDPMTPYPGAVDVSRQLPGSVLLTYEGDGHTTYTQSPCIRAYVDNYLTGGTLPPAGTSCPDVMG